jgi:hypothetical protein
VKDQSNTFCSTIQESMQISCLLIFKSIRRFFYAGIVQNALLFLILLFCGNLPAQHVALSASNPNSAPDAPAGVSASDGDHEKYILIRWEPANGAQQYRVYRSTSSKTSSMQEVTKSWQKSTWFCDYGVQKGVDYYYAIIGGNGAQKSALSNFDKGFVRKDDARAGVEDLSDARGLTTSPAIYLLVSNVLAEKDAASAGDTLVLSVNLQNIFEEPTPAAQMRVFLSKDVVFDWDDVELSKKVYTSFPAGESIVLREKVVLPKPLPAGTYNLIVVTSMEGNILNSKTGLEQLKIED